MKDGQVLQELSKELDIILNKNNFNLGKQLLSERINELIDTNFQKLVSILYRMDISESKLKQLLADNPGTDAGLIIADLMIQRQEEKIRTRQHFSKRDENISDEEKW